jgi:hypothetical protein
MYAVWEVGHYTISTDRMRDEKADLGIGPHRDMSVTKDSLETYTQGMAPSSLFQTMPRQRRQTIMWLMVSIIFMW